MGPARSSAVVDRLETLPWLDRTAINFLIPAGFARNLRLALEISLREMRASRMAQASAAASRHAACAASNSGATLSSSASMLTECSYARYLLAFGVDPEASANLASESLALAADSGAAATCWVPKCARWPQPN